MIYAVSLPFTHLGDSLVPLKWGYVRYTFTVSVLSSANGSRRAPKLTGALNGTGAEKCTAVNRIECKKTPHFSEGLFLSVEFGAY